MKSTPKSVPAVSGRTKAKVSWRLCLFNYSNVLLFALLFYVVNVMDRYLRHHAHGHTSNLPETRRLCAVTHLALTAKIAIEQRTRSHRSRELDTNSARTALRFRGCLCWHPFRCGRRFGCGCRSSRCGLGMSLVGLNLVDFALLISAPKEIKGTHTVVIGAWGFCHGRGVELGGLSRRGVELEGWGVVGVGGVGRALSSPKKR